MELPNPPQQLNPRRQPREEKPNHPARPEESELQESPRPQMFNVFTTTMTLLNECIH